MKIFKCISKNLKVLVRSKLASFVIVLAPMLLFLLLQIALNVPEQFTLDIGVYSEKFSPISDAIVLELRDNNIRVAFTISREECIASVQGGTYSTCIVFPSNMSLGMKEDTVTIFVDTSKNNIVWAIKDILRNKIEKETISLSSNMTIEVINHVNLVQEGTVARQKDVSRALALTKNASKANAVSLANANVMNFSINRRNFNVTAIKDGIQLAKTFANNAMVKAKSLASSISSDFDKMEDSATLYITNHTARLKYLDIINDTKTYLKSTSQALSYNANSSNINLGDVREHVANLVVGYSALTESIKKNTGLKSDSVTKLQTMAKEIEATLSELNKINATLAEFHRSFDQIKILEPQEIVEPFELKVESITPTKSQMSLIFPQFLAIIILFVSLIIPTMMSVSDKRSHSGTRERLTPVYRVVYIMGIYLTNLLLMFIEVILTVVLTRFVLDINVLPNLPSITLSVLLSGSAFIMIGIFLGQLFNEEHNALIAAVSIACLLLFMSGVIIPIEAMPPQFYHANLYNPFVVTISLLRQEIFYSMPIVQLLPQMIFLLLFAMAFYFFTFLYLDIFKRKKI